MRFAIDVAFVARAGRVVKLRRAVQPWRVAGALRVFAFVELPAGAVDRTEILSGDVLRVTGLERSQSRSRFDVVPALESMGPKPGRRERDTPWHCLALVEGRIVPTPPTGWEDGRLERRNTKTVTVSTTKAPLFNEPRVLPASLSELPTGSEAPVVQVEGDWYLVRFEDRRWDPRV